MGGTLRRPPSGSETIGPVGNYWGSSNNGSTYSPSPQNWCDGFEPLVGFEGRSDLTNSDTLRYITGLQPICGSDDSEETEYVGNTQGWINGRRACPRGMIGVGVAAAPDQSNSGDLGLLGLLCASKDKVDNLSVNDNYDNSDLLIAHGDFSNSGVIYRFLTEDYEAFLQRHGLGSSYDAQKCSGGEVVSSIRFEYDSGDKELTQVDRVVCSDSSTSTHYYPGIGPSGNSSKTLGCENQHTEGVYGFSAADANGTNGVSLWCRGRD